MTTAFEILFVNNKGWIVEENGFKWENKRGNTRIFHLKQDAVDKVRREAKNRKPSVMRIYGMKGDLIREANYN